VETLLNGRGGGGKRKADGKKGKGEHRTLPKTGLLNPGKKTEHLMTNAAVPEKRTEIRSDGKRSNQLK